MVRKIGIAKEKKRITSPWRADATKWGVVWSNNSSDLLIIPIPIRPNRSQNRFFPSTIFLSTWKTRASLAQFDWWGISGSLHLHSWALSYSPATTMGGPFVVWSKNSSSLPASKIFKFFNADEFRERAKDPLRCDRFVIEDFATDRIHRIYRFYRIRKTLAFS